MHAERYRVPDADPGRPSPGADGRVVAVGTTAVRALESAAATGAPEAAPSCSSATPTIRAWSTCCSPTSTCPARRCSRWSTRSSGPAGATSTTTALADGYRFLSFGDAMLLDRRTEAPMTPVAIDVEATDGAARGGRVTHRPGLAPHAAVHAGRHPGRGAPLSSADLEALGAAVDPRQHVPPHAPARRRAWSPARAGCTGSWTGTATCSPTRAASRSSRSSPRSTTTAPRSGPPTTARSTASRPRAAVDVQAQLGRRHPDGARRLPAPARRRRRSCAARSTAPRLWADRARARSWRHDAARPGPVRHRAGRRRPRRCGPRAPSGPSPSASTATRSAACRWGRPRRDAPRPGRRASSVLPADQPRYLMGVGDPAGHRRGRRPRHRHVRLRPADPPGPPRHDPHRRRAASTCATRRYARRRRAARPHLRAAPSAPAGPAATSATCSVGEPTAPRLLTIHNVAWTLRPRRSAPGRDRGGHAGRPAGRGRRGLGAEGRRRSGTARSGSASTSSRFFAMEPLRRRRHPRSCPALRAASSPPAEAGQGPSASWSPRSREGDDVILRPASTGASSTAAATTSCARGRRGRGAVTIARLAVARRLDETVTDRGRRAAGRTPSRDRRKRTRHEPVRRNRP